MLLQVLRSVAERWVVALTLFFALVFGLAFSAHPAWGQATAAINGTVLDSAGAVVPGAKVVLHNRDTGLDRPAVTNQDGQYVMPDVQPGNYDLRITKAGFVQAVETHIILAVNQTATYDFKLKVGGASEVVEVEADPVALETSTSEVGVAVVEEQVKDLPLNGRNFTQLLNLTPGVSSVNVSQNSTTSGGVWSNPIGDFSYPSVNGQTNRSNLFLLDGVNNEGSFGGTYTFPPIVDDIQEFKVQSHNDDASFGGVLGGVINVVTKSGTSSLHGAAWEFVRNKAFDAGLVSPQESAAAQAAATAANNYQQNQFGATAGGPLPVPGEHHKKTFFFLAYEGYRRNQAAGSSYITPNTTEMAAIANGADANFPMIVNQITNPFNGGKPFMCSGPGVPEPAPGGIQAPGGTPCNVIPNSMIDQNMVKYATTMFPGPNITATSATGFNGQDLTKGVIRQDEGSVRLDHQFGERDNMWARYSGFRQPVSGSGGYQGLVHNQITTGYQAGIDYTHLFSGQTLVEFHAGRNNMKIDQGTEPKSVPVSFGTTIFNTNFASGFKNGVSMIPEVYIQGYIGSSNPSAHGAAQIDDTHASDIWEYGGNFTKTMGRHTIKAGANFASNNIDAVYLNSSVEFMSANTGDGLASFLLGVPNNASRRNVVETMHGGWVDGYYAMDQWKVNNKININVGGRYDVTYMPIYGNSPNDNYYVGDMDFTSGTYDLAHNAPACSSSQGAPCIPGGALPAHVELTPLSGGAIYHNDFSNIQPRVGFTYELRPNTEVRIGYGRFYDNWAAITQTSQNFEGTWPSLDQLGASNLNLSGKPTVTAENPLSQSSGPPVTGPTPFTQSTWFADPYLKRPYGDQWNFGIQQQIASKDVLTVNYVGGAGSKLDVGGAYNVASQPGGNVGCPSYATDPEHFNCGAPFPYIGVTAYDRSVGKSSYNALQVTLNGRAQHGLTYLVSYTFSKSLDLGCDGFYGVEGCSIQNPYNLQGDKGHAATDLPQIFSVAWVYEIPFGLGRHTLENPSANWLLGGWSLNGVLTANSGDAFDVGTGKDQAETGNYNYGNGYGYERANLQGSPYPDQKSTTAWINPSAFALPALGTFGNLGRDTLRSDMNNNLDLSLFRTIPIKEQFRAEFRFEAFNALNHPVWAVPVTDMDLPTFGQVQSTANAQRQLQFGLKIYY